MEIRCTPQEAVELIHLLQKSDSRNEDNFSFGCAVGKNAVQTDGMAGGFACGNAVHTDGAAHGFSGGNAIHTNGIA